MESHSTLPLKQHIVYGPVASRRLGRSLGVNILPPQRKTCTFNCAYCQYGWTPWIPLADMMDAPWPSVQEIEAAVETALAALPEPVDSLTLSGNGEPTLHPTFPYVVDCLIRLRDRYTPRARTALLSNASTIASESIRTAVGKLDLRAMKLDAGSPRMLTRYNRPIIDVDFNSLVHSLTMLPDVTIQSLFSAGEGGNAEPVCVEEWLHLIAVIRPAHVQLYTLHRPYPSWQITPLDRSALLGIRDRVRGAGVDAEVY